MARLKQKKEVNGRLCVALGVVYIRLSRTRTQSTFGRLEAKQDQLHAATLEQRVMDRSHFSDSSRSFDYCSFLSPPLFFSF
jgi:hypothetical protein